MQIKVKPTKPWGKFTDPFDLVIIWKSWNSVGPYFIIWKSQDKFWDHFLSLESDYSFGPFFIIWNSWNSVGPYFIIWKTQDKFWHHYLPILATLSTDIFSLHRVCFANLYFGKVNFCWFYTINLQSLSEIFSENFNIYIYSFNSIYKYFHFILSL